MKHTLLMQLAGPMQAWGTQSRFTIRETGLEPTKSGVIGLACAALGWDRKWNYFTLSGGIKVQFNQLTALRMGVRVLREGKVRYDYQVAGKDGYLRAGGAVESHDVIPSKRYYLADATFLVGLQGEESDLSLLEEINRALHNPVWPLSLGRKSFVPARPIWTTAGLVQRGLFESLDEYKPANESLDVPLPKMRRFGSTTDRYVIEYDETDETLSGGIRRLAGPDQPINFELRRYSLREVVVIPSSLIEEVTDESQ